MATTMRNMYDTKTFAEIYDDSGTFIWYYNDTGMPSVLTNDEMVILYTLLYARHGNDPIANYDENQFKFKVASVIWQHGPIWKKKLEIQANLRALTIDELVEGTKAVHNHAYNPGEIGAEHATDTQPVLQYIDQQNVTKYTKNKMDGYLQLWNMISNDVSDEFLSKFDNLFKKFVKPGTYIYVTEEDEDDEA